MDFNTAPERNQIIFCSRGLITSNDLLKSSATQSPSHWWRLFCNINFIKVMLNNAGYFAITSSQVQQSACLPGLSHTHYCSKLMIGKHKHWSTVQNSGNKKKSMKIVQGNGSLSSHKYLSFHTDYVIYSYRDQGHASERNGNSKPGNKQLFATAESIPH